MGKLAGKEQEIIEKYESGLSTTKLAKEYNVVDSSILKLLRRNNIQTRHRTETRFISQANYNKVSNKALNMISGWLLGDGWLDNKGSQARFGFHSKHKEYIDHVKSILEKEGVICKIHGDYSLYTRCSVQFKNLYDKWYPALNRKKIIPKDLSLCADTMKYWFIDDGTSDKYKRYIEMATCAFTMNECKFLIDKIKKFIGNLSGDKINIKMKNKKYPVIYINHKDSCSILEKVGNCPVNCYEYKWDKVFAGGVNCSV
jgi:hypothetical protein